MNISLLQVIRRGGKSVVHNDRLDYRRVFVGIMYHRVFYFLCEFSFLI